MYIVSVSLHVFHMYAVSVHSFICLFQVHTVSDELIAQMDAAQCLILVLTLNFLENEWRTLQIKTSHQLFARNRSKRVIAVLGDGQYHRK